MKLKNTSAWLLTFVIAFIFIAVDQTTALNQKFDTNPVLYDFKGTLLSGKTVPLSNYKGKVVLLTNIALKCGTTPQLRELQALYTEYSPKGLVILGFPSNDFTGVEPSEPEVIQRMCKTNFGVTFPLLVPGAVTGPKKQEVFAFLTSNGPEDIQGEVGFNFEKFLVDKNGMVRKRFGPFNGAQSEAVRKSVEDLLNE